MPTADWTKRVWNEYHAGNLTRAYRDVLLTLRSFRSAGGLCIPSHATLAERAQCSASTALRACQQAKHLGLLVWCERRIRRGWRWLRTSNAYEFLVPDHPAEPAMPRPRGAPSTNRKNSGGGESLAKKEALLGLFRLAASVPDLLAARRATMAPRFGAS